MVTTMDFDQEFLNKIKCPECEENDFDLKIQSDNSDQSGYIICNACNNKYYIRDGILYLTPHIIENKVWDNIYTDDIKGNFQNSLDDLYNTLNISLNDKRSALTYYSLIGLVSKSHKIFNYSLELGCGTASYSLLLKKFEYVSSPVLIDTSIIALKKAQSVFEHFNENAYFIYADGLNIPFIDKTFDLSFSGGLIEHFKGAEQKKIVSEHCRVAQTVICQFPTNSIAYWIQRIGITLLNFKWPFGYEKPVSYIDANKLFKDEKFEIISSSYHDFLTALLFRLSRKYPYIRPLTSKRFINRLFKTEVIISLQSDDAESSYIHN